MGTFKMYPGSSMLKKGTWILFIYELEGFVLVASKDFISLVHTLPGRNESKSMRCTPYAFNTCIVFPNLEKLNEYLMNQMDNTQS